MEIAPLLNIVRGVTAIIGSGGKTTLLYTLAEELKEKGSVIICTSTHIRIPERYNTVTGGTAELEEALNENKVVCAGTPVENGKLTAAGISFEELENIADYVLVEADGSKGLPLKAHADHEPVIPDNTENTILVIGADGIGRRVSDVCHRPEIWKSITGTDMNDAVTPEDIAKVITTEDLGDIVLINKAESDADREQAGKLAEKLNRPVVIGSLQRKEYIKWQ